MADARARFDALRPGERLTYASGVERIRGEMAAWVRGLYEAGAVELFQPRRRGGGFDFLIEKRPLPESSLRKPYADPATRAILGALMRAARHGRPCPSNAQLARIAELATRAQAQWRFDRLRALGVIESEATGDAAIGRVVTIVRTGRRTAAPNPLSPTALPHRGEGQERQEQA